VSISPPSDIVLDVAKAADPQKYRAAMERLVKVSGGSPAEPETSVAAAIDEVAAKANRSEASAAAGNVKPLPDQTAPGKNQLGALPARTAEQQSNPYEEFEAFFLRTFVESMLPKEAESLFGSGPGSDIWKSMLAEHMANELARGTTFGIAEQIADHRKTVDAAKTPAIEQSTEDGQTAQASGILSSLKRILSAQGELATTPVDREAA